MDVEQARTFVSVMETRNFVRSAEQLHVTQSTVSARIKALEDRLGCRLFNRNKAGVFLTAEGQRFARHAANFIRIWGQARQEIGLPDEITARLNIGAQISHWDSVVVNWVGWLRETRPDIAIRAEVGSNESLMRQLVDGLLDLVVVYTPQTGPGLTVEPLFDEQIVLVSSRRDRSRPENDNPDWQKDYIYVDWGAEFRAQHALAWPGLETPPLYFSVGTVALDYLLAHGGSGYFPARICRRHVAEKKLFRVAGAPSFTRPVYMVWNDSLAEPPFEEILFGLRRIAIDTQLNDRAGAPAAGTTEKAAE